MGTLKCSLLSAGFVVLSTGWAAAAPAVVLDYLNLRYAPGYDQYIIEVIPPGWIVNTGACASGWCQVNVNGVLGFVDSDYLGAPAPGYWPTFGYAYGWTYPYYAYGYGGGPYAGPYAGVYAQGETRTSRLPAGRSIEPNRRRLQSTTERQGRTPPSRQRSCTDRRCHRRGPLEGERIVRGVPRLITAGIGSRRTATGGFSHRCTVLLWGAIQVRSPFTGDGIVK